MAVNPLAWLQGLEGLTLVLAIAGLLFIEEVGLPIPFAPGDLVLAIAGIAIAAGRVEPVPMVLSAFLATVLGAVLGREIFALLGWERLLKIARRLHAATPLERAAEMLHRNGWRAVFTARLIPGLRVHTTQVAGVTRMPRFSFLAGLLPAATVYIAAFVGLGVAFGRPAIELIHQGEHRLVTVILLVAFGTIVLLLTRAEVRRTLASLRVAGWPGLFKLELDSPWIVLIPACIGLNVAGHAIAVAFNLPLILDSTGTILAGLLAGPWVGASVGLVTVLASSGTFAPSAAPYGVVAVPLGFVAGLGRYLTWPSQRQGWLELWLVCLATAAVLSTPLNLLIRHGRTGVPLGDAVNAYLTNAHVPSVIAAFIGEMAVDLPDKLAAVAAALLIYHALPQPRAERLRVELNLADAFTYVFRSSNWVRKAAIAAVCLLFFWALLIPFFLFVGYSVAIARNIRRGDHELPPWSDLRPKIKDGFLVSAALFLWNLPGELLSTPAEGPLPAVGSVWSLLVLIVQTAIWSQYLQEGFRASFNVLSIMRRLRFNMDLTLVVGALGIVLSQLSVVGVVGLGVGLLVTFTYANWVSAYLSGTYARLTDPALVKAV
jgi:energy-coupling factor transport system substrate-specific component